MAEITAEFLPPRLANLGLSLYDYSGRLVTANLYAKVSAHLSDRPPVFRVTFTAIPAEAEAFLAEPSGSHRKT